MRTIELMPLDLMDSRGMVIGIRTPITFHTIPNPDLMIQNQQMAEFKPTSITVKLGKVGDQRVILQNGRTLFQSPPSEPCLQVSLHTALW